MTTRNSQLKNNQAGFAHLGMLILFIAVFAALGGVGYRVYTTNQGEVSSVVSEQSFVNEEDDEDGEVLPPEDTEQDEPVDVEAENATDV